MTCSSGFTQINIFVIYIAYLTDSSLAVDNLTKVFRIKKSDDLELSKGSGGIPHCEAYRCSSCKKILIDYANR